MSVVANKVHNLSSTPFHRELKATRELFDELTKALRHQNDTKESLMSAQAADQHKVTEEMMKYTNEELKSKAAALQGANDELKQLREELKGKEADLTANTLRIFNLCKEYDEVEKKLFPLENWSKTEKLEG